MNTLVSPPTQPNVDSTNSQDWQAILKIISESELFDFDFYKSQLNEQGLSRGQAILHYLNTGAKTGVDPHPLFDTTFYITTNNDIDFTTVNPLVHFINNGWREQRNPHPLFDVQYYLDRYKDVCKAKINPLKHFIIFGAKEHRHPCEFFDSVHYKKHVHERGLREFFAAHFRSGNIDFSRHLKTTNFKVITSAPKYLSLYLAAAKRLGILDWIRNYRFGKISPLIQPVENPLLHFLSQGVQWRLFPFGSFELLYDIRPRSAQYSRIIPRKLTNLEWVPVEFAQLADQINKAQIPADKLPLLKELIESLTLKKNSHGFLRSKPTILLVSHQAALTGSPMLLLQIAKALSGHGYECLLLLEQGGELEEEFSQYAHIINFKYKEDRYKKCKQYLSLLFDDLRLQKPKVCLLNSAETGYYADAINSQAIKIISLVHEIVDSYSPAFLQNIFERSQSVIFPAIFVQDFAHKKLGERIKPVRESVIPNALLEDSFGNYDRLHARDFLRKRIEAPSNSLIVLACGSPDLRKGIDYFVTIAKIIINNLRKHDSKLLQPVHFVWLGASKNIEPWSAHYYIDWDVRQENLQSKIHLLPPQKDLRPIFNGADIFILPSRQDPFPIVVHNAMAAALPIVSFRNAGGVPEMIDGGGAKLVPYGDVLAFAQAIEQYLLDEDQRTTDGQLNVFLVADRFRFSNYFAKLETEIKTIAG